MKLMPKEGEIVDVQAYKYDGTLYRQLNGLKVIKVLSDKIVLFAFKTKVAEDNGDKWIIREPQLWFFPFEKLYNTTVLLRNSGAWFYTNLSSPPIYEDGAIKYIDFDLDIKMYPDKPLKIVDQFEYEKNKHLFRYPQKLIQQIDYSVTELINLFYEKKTYFNQTTIDKYIYLLESNMLIFDLKNQTQNKKRK